MHQVYLQQYLVRHRVFIRGGAGVAITSTLQPQSGEIQAARYWRAALTTRASLDLPVACWLYVTPSLDFTVLPGTNMAERKLRSGVAMGVALTLR